MAPPRPAPHTRVPGSLGSVTSRNAHRLHAQRPGEFSRHPRTAGTRVLATQTRPNAIGDGLRGPGVLIGRHGRYEKCELLRRGVSDMLYRCRNVEQGGEVLLREIGGRRGEDASESAVRVQCERSTLHRLQGYAGAVGLIETFHTTNGLALVMEPCPGGSLRSYLQTEGAVSESSARQIAATLLTLLKSCDEQNILHGHVSPDHLWMKTSYCLQPHRYMCYGLASNNEVTKGLASDANAWLRSLYMGLCGVKGFYRTDEAVISGNHVAYWAPERLAGHHQGISDNFSLGLTLYELVTGHHPFWGDREIKGIRKMMKGDPSLLHGLLRDLLWIKPSFEDLPISPDGKQFIEGLLEINMWDRMTIDEALNHKWLKCMHQPIVHVEGRGSAARANNSCSLVQ